MALSSRTRHAIKEVFKVIQMEEFQYNDPVTCFLQELYIEFDFEAAQPELPLAGDMMGNDFFPLPQRVQGRVFGQRSVPYQRGILSDSSKDRHCEFVREVESYAGGRREVDCEPDSGGEDCGCEDRFGKGFVTYLVSTFCFF